ncbi:MAG TPA: hypothetical protein P5086_12415 [Prolixibacteraceae bacterium]|jgi:hypothetical protein|nr:hypothetical protein [Prolixibacteraceae bacterium]HPJ77573.1 hypothetical protein [Prolixibacteraceae bacterium]HRV90104.1 hypothetical protein [Prolixibacteraceae bacterium]
MKPFSECIQEYRKLVKQGEIVTAYRGLMEFMATLRTHFKNQHPELSVPGNLYFGYMDMTYFPLVPEKLKTKGLKIAIVLVHEDVRFEAWLSGTNKTIQAEYWELFRNRKWDHYRIPESLKGRDSIIECDLALDPDFSDPGTLIRQIEDRTIQFINDVMDHQAK